MSLLYTNRPPAGKRPIPRIRPLSHNGKNGSPEPDSLVGTTRNGNGHVQPFSLPDPHNQVKPKRFCGWRKTIAMLENWAAQLAPDDPRWDEIREIIASLKAHDQEARKDIFQFLLACMADGSSEYEAVLRRKLASLSSPSVRPIKSAA
jgi:hypothetical protein